MAHPSISAQTSALSSSPRAFRRWLSRIGVKTLYIELDIELGSPWENGYCESFNSKLRDELLKGKQFSTPHEA